MYRALVILMLTVSPLFAQEGESHLFFLESNYFYGSLLSQSKGVAHLVRNQPEGVMLSFNKKTFGNKYWQEVYNYPDWGISFVFQNFKNEVIGENYAVYGHLNFYFFNRNLQLRVAEGIGFNTKPFDLETNFKNNAYGSRFLASTYFKLNYHKPNIFRRFGVQAGLSFVHHSNGSFKTPNSGTNVFAVNIGLNYSLETDNEPVYISAKEKTNFREPIAYNIFLRGGMNEGDYYNLGQEPFIVIGGFVDKRLNYKSTLQLGAEVFFSKFLEREIEYRAISFLSSGLTGNEDYKRVGIFVGHELRLGKFAIPTQLGYYVYWPYEYELRVYTRVGVKYYFTEKLFAAVTVKSHAANAEAIEFGLGIRL